MKSHALLLGQLRGLQRGPGLRRVSWGLRGIIGHASRWRVPLRVMPAAPFLRPQSPGNDAQ